MTGIRVVRNRIEAGRAVPTGEEEVIGCGLVFRSIGYTGRPVGDVPFDPARGLIRNDGGRVCDEEGVPHRGEYAVGWIKRGPSGVIGTNKKDAADTVAKIVADAEAGVLDAPRPDADDVRAVAGRAARRTPSRGRAGRRSTSTSAPPGSRTGGRASSSSAWPTSWPPGAGSEARRAGRARSREAVGRREPADERIGLDGRGGQDRLRHGEPEARAGRGAVFGHGQSLARRGWRSLPEGMRVLVSDLADRREREESCVSS